MKGNLIDLAEQGQFNVIVHGCNCFHTMGAGIAKEIATRYPPAYVADCILTKNGDETKLGKYTWQEVHAYTGRSFIVVNAYTQYKYGRGGPHVDYDAIKSAFNMIAKQFGGSTIGYPKIGAGFGGGDWNKIQTIINTELQGVVHHLVTLN